LEHPEEWKSTTTHIPAFTYNTTKQVWTSTLEPYQIDTAQQPVQSFSTISYNVWFDQLFKKERYSEIFRICDKYSPDVICFQEVTIDFIAQLEMEQWCRDKYLVSDLSTSMKSFHGWYGVLMLVKKTVQCQKLVMNTLVTGMSRSCLTAEILVNNQLVQIATVHLESLDTRQIRAFQLRDICTNILTNNTSILMGDFNFDDERNWDSKDKRPIENLIFTSDPVVSQYTDVWTQLKPNDPGKSFDSSVNKMINHQEMMRYDRVIYKSTHFHPLNIEMIGTRKLMTVRGTHVFPSDHFGLYTQFQIL
jgi:endonuclease/exonuclease/phosphatase family metal-dependent hydrolase